MPIALANDHLRTVIDPDQGTSLHSFQVCRNGAWLSLMPDAEDPSCDLAAASFLMAPYSNRIADGAFTFAGQRYELQNAANHAIHGDVRNRPWTIASQSDQRLVCTFDSADCENVNWPWAFAVRAEYELDGPALRQRLAIENRADCPMPAGCGWHPFFNRAPTAADTAVHLEFQVESAYPDGYGNRIPSGRAEPLADHQDFRAAKPLAPDNFLDTCFHGYDGGGHIAWPASGIRLRFACSAACTHLILYNPPGKPYFAVEPVTNANDGVNLHAHGDQTSGIAVLEPGQGLEVSFELWAECV
ncbi:MAG: hypothetical protein QGH25_13555 [Candidatus Latescibacteria bacterium]|jgi:aldose 1-epimerase|nr:hypothetical protein [Candidatus Latescibacterota bacterium]